MFSNLQLWNTFRQTLVSLVESNLKFLREKEFDSSGLGVNFDPFCCSQEDAEVELPGASNDHVTTAARGECGGV